MNTKQDRNTTLPQAKPEGCEPGKARMGIDRIIHTFAGALVMASLALAHWHSPHWLWLTLFVGLNLFQSGLTNWCLGSRILARLGVPNDGACGLK